MAHILILAPQIPVPPQALTGTSQGTTIRNFNLLAGLAKHHTVDLLTFFGPAEAEESQRRAVLDLLAPYCRTIIAEPMPLRSLSRRRAIHSRTRFLTWRCAFSALKCTHTPREILAAQRYDVIQVEGVEMAPYAMHARGRTPCPRWVFDDHNAEYVLQQRAFLTDVRRPRRWLAAAYSLVQWRKLTRYERGVCRAADRVVAVSDVDAAALRRLAPGLDVTVIPNGVDLMFNQPGAVLPADGMGPHALVFTGKMDYRPNVDAVIWFVDEVLPLIRAQIPDVRFYAVGQQPHARISALAADPGVIVTGRVPDVRPYIAGAGVYVVPLRIGGGTRLKVLEAMALGQAMVSTRLGCDGFPFEDGRELRFADDPAAFAAAVLDLLRDRDQAAALGRRARAYVEAHFGWDAIVPRLEALYA